jgi:hypothetical protein
MSIVHILQRVQVIYDALREQKPNVALCYNAEIIYFEDVTQDDVAVSPELLWVDLEKLNEMELNSIIIDLFNNISLSRKFILPSKFNIGDKVKIVFGDAGTIKNCKIIKVHFSHSKVLYDVEVIIHNEMIESDFISNKEKYIKEALLTRLYNIDSVFILPSE